MTRIDFYLLDDATEGAKDAAVCKLAHKAFRLGHRIYILTRNDEDAKRLDHLLWTFSDTSFIPHGLGTQPADANLPVLLGKEEPPATHDDVLIQIAPEAPEFFSRFQRVAELVDGSDDGKTRARERFRFYRDRGYTLQTHHLAPDAAQG